MIDRAAEMVLTDLGARHGSQWLSGPRQRAAGTGGGELLRALIGLGLAVPARRRPDLERLRDFRELWRAFFFRGVVLDSHEGQLGWMDGRYPLIARLDIPEPAEMLDIQCAGRRYVTLLVRPEQRFIQYGRHAGAAAFLLHDFEHAHKFFADPDSHRGQVRFFRALKAAVPELAHWRSDQRFAHDLDYLMSDMNSHPVHLTKYFKAIVLAAEIRRAGDPRPALDGFFRALFTAWGMNGETLEAALSLNQPEMESAARQRQVADFFMAADSACAPALSAST